MKFPENWQELRRKTANFHEGRAEGWLFWHIALLALYVAMPALRFFWLPWPITFTGFLILMAGWVLLIRSYRTLKPVFGWHPVPKEPHALIATGLYGVVRHPMDASLLLILFGFGLWRSNLAALAIAVGFFFFLEAKTAYEEKRLTERHPVDYPAYQRRVGKWTPRFKTGLTKTLT